MPDLQRFIVQGENNWTRDLKLQPDDIISVRSYEELPFPSDPSPERIVAEGNTLTRPLHPNVAWFVREVFGADPTILRPLPPEEKED